MQIGKFEPIPNRTDIFPTIGWNGDVVLLSPELLTAKSSNYDFVVGNIREKSLRKILNHGQNAPYVKEYRMGVEKCRESCQFFGYCRGGQVANKFFEHGSIAVTETRHCRNSQQKPLEAIIAFLETQPQFAERR